MSVGDPYSVIPLVLLAACLLTAGCSARVEHERTNGSETEASMTSIIEVDRTTVQLDFQPRPPQPTLPTEPPPKPAAPPVSPLTISGNTFVFNYQAGDTYYHSETDVRIQQSPPPGVEERIVIRTEPDRQVSEECEYLRMQHEDRVRKWRGSPGTMGQ